MAKVALLIGVSDYQAGLSPLPGSQTDIQAMQRVLQDPLVGGFDQVELLANPDPMQMQLAIERLFTEQRSPDDLVLLYFSGHGLKDDNGGLHFATTATQKNEQGRIFTSTAVPASFVQHQMGHRIKRQILILDCCFAGAFAKDLKAKSAEEAVDIKTQLGGEGRVVLTSSTATQVSDAGTGNEVSIYTRYLVQGLKTGAADRNGDGQISVDELHEYACEKVQEASPRMKPEIYAVKEGYKILLAKAPQGDPKLIYRKEFEARAKLKRGNLSKIDCLSLKFRWQQLGLQAAEVEQIEAEILLPYQQFWAKVKEFEEVVQEALEDDPQMGAVTVDDLRYFLRVLQLQETDVAEILAKLGVSLADTGTRPEPAKPVVEIKSSSKPASVLPVAPKPGPTQLVEPEDDLSSEKGIDYGKLRDLLKARQWKEADKETYELILRAVGRKLGDYIREKELLNFPCTDLKTIDRLWVKYSQGRFGFSMQKKIYVECGAKLDGKYPGDKVWEEFGDRVGWRKDGDWLSYSDLDVSLSSPQGLFPGWLADGLGGGRRGGWFFSRTQACEL